MTEKPLLAPKVSISMDVACLGLLLIVRAAASKPAPTQTTVINTTLGPIRGSSNGGVWSFKAIPFAKAPVDDLRFRPPQPFDAPWHQVLDCTGDFGPYCIQDSEVNGVPDEGSSEDW